MTQKTLFCFRQDLRLTDNPSFYAACQNGPVMAIYILDDITPQSFKMGGASRWWLHHSLSMLEKQLDYQLNFYQGRSQDIILGLLEEQKFDAIYWNRCYEPWRMAHDADTKAKILKRGVDCKSFNGSLLWEPMDVVKSDGTPYKVFTPFYRNGCLKARLPRHPLEKPAKVDLIKDNNNSTELKDLNLLDPIKWYSSMEPHWTIGEEGAQARLKTFLDSGLQNYKEGRDFPAKNHVSRLSPHLHFGEISPHQVWSAIQAITIEGTLSLTDIDHFRSELGWREFSYSLLYHFPDLPRQNFQKKFDAFSWQTNSELLRAWQRGKTGYPIVDAGMRELWQTGYMHNRVRMITGSFLVKNLLLHWHHGEDWFWDCLVDADLASNSASWQWIAGSGADAAPYFRIFNPVTQGEKFDPQGMYTRKFVPELAQLPDRYLFKPWEAPESILKTAGVVLGETYPKPIVDLKKSRMTALEAFSLLSSGAS